MAATARAAGTHPHAAPKRRRSTPAPDPRQRLLGPETHWWQLLAAIQIEWDRGESVLRPRELRAWEACIRNSDSNTGRCADKAGRPLSARVLAAAAGMSIPNFYRALERLRLEPSTMPPHPGRGDGKRFRKGQGPSNARPRRDDCAPRAEPLGLVHVVHTPLDFDGCDLSTRRECDTRHRAAVRAARARSDREMPPGCVFHHGQACIELVVRTGPAWDAVRARAGDEVHNVRRSGGRRAVDNPANGSTARSVENPYPDPVRESLSTGPESLSGALSPRAGSIPPPPGSVGGPFSTAAADAPTAPVGVFAPAAQDVAPSAPRLPCDPVNGDGATREALRSEPAADLAKNRTDARRGWEAGGATSGPKSLRVHAQAAEIALIVQAWGDAGLKPMERLPKVLANLLDDGASLTELADVVDGVRWGQGEQAFARDTARDPAAAAYANLWTVERYARAGRKARDARAAIAWREARQREADERARIAAQAEAAKAGDEPKKAEESLLEAERHDAPKPRIQPGAAAVRAALARERERQLELLCARAAEDARREAAEDGPS